MSGYINNELFALLQASRGSSMTITFESLNESHFPLLLRWLESVHVKKWWDQDMTYTMELVKEKFGRHIHGLTISNSSNKRTHAYIITVDKEKIGYIQAYNVRDFSHENGLDLGSISGSICGVDLFIGDPNYIHKGIGPLILNEFDNQILASHFDLCLIDPAKDNLSAIKAFEKAGFKKLAEQSSVDKVWMIRKKEANWDLCYIFEDVVYKEKDNVIKRILDQFDVYDFLSIPIVYDLVKYKKIRLLKLLHNKGIPLNYEEWCGGNALHIACAAGGNLESVKFFIENCILTDINKRSLKCGDTPLNLTISYEHSDILKYFQQKFGINSISFDDLDVVLDRVKANYRRYHTRKEYFKNKD